MAVAPLRTLIWVNADRKEKGHLAKFTSTKSDEPVALVSLFLMIDQGFLFTNYT
jgi:hypothetical protein